MSFVTTQPAELAAAAGKLEAIGSTMDAQNAAALAPTTTGVVPAAADEISALQASLFTAYGTLYQKINADAEAYSIKTRAEAEADANDKIAKSLTEALIRYTEAQRWNGELPGTFLGSSDALPVINVEGNGGN